MQYRFKLFLLIILIYFILVLRLNTIERLVYQIPNGAYFSETCDSLFIFGVKRFFFILAIKIIFPIYVFIFPDWYSHSIHEGIAISYALTSNNYQYAYLDYHQNKLKWKNLFNKYNIKNPKLFAYISNNKLKIIEQPKEKLVLFKPNKDSMGRGIYIDSWNNIVNHPPKQDGLIEKWYTISPPKHYRVVTVSNLRDPAFIIAKYKITDSTQDLVSNRGKVTFDIERPIHKQFLNLHQREFFNIFSISWDFIIYDNMELALEGNINGATCWKTDCKEILTKFKKNAEIYFKYFIENNRSSYYHY